MIIIKPNAKLQIHAVKSGEGKTGYWELFQIRDGTLPLYITVCPDTIPSGLKDGDWFELAQIHDVHVTPRRGRGWFANVLVHAEINGPLVEYGEEMKRKKNHYSESSCTYADLADNDDFDLDL